MPDDADRPEETGWVLKPSSGAFNIAVGPDAVLTPEIQEALDDLLQAIEAEEETAGFAFGLFTTCTSDGACGKVFREPNCLRYEICNPKTTRMW